MTEPIRRVTMMTATAHRPTRRKPTQAEFIISRWRKQRIKKRMSLSGRDSRYADHLTMLFLNNVGSCSLQDVFSPYRKATAATGRGYQLKSIHSSASSRRKGARFHDVYFRAGEDDR